MTFTSQNYANPLKVMNIYRHPVNSDEDRNHTCDPFSLPTGPEDGMITTDMVWVNDGSHTRFNPHNLKGTTLDLSIVYSSMDPKVEWAVGKSIGSDHLPIILDVATGGPSSKTAKKQTHWNFKKFLGRKKCLGHHDNMCVDISIDEVHHALHRTPEISAPGLEKVCNAMLKQLGPDGIEALRSLYNLSLRQGVTPASWRLPHIIPITKAGKPPEKSSSYRPISLTSCLVKVMERIIQARLSTWLERQPYLL